MPQPPVLFNLSAHPLAAPLAAALGAQPGVLEQRRFPDGESYLRVLDVVDGRDCLILVDLAHPDPVFLPLAFLAASLRELGARQVGLVAPYLSYMRQDMRFKPGEALTSAIFARQLSALVDWLVTVDPHLHRWHSLDQIYSIPSRVVQGASLLARWLAGQQRVLLVGPDAESEQWVSAIAAQSGHPFVVGRKERLGDRKVIITLPDLAPWQDHAALIIDDVISSGHTVLKCIDALQQQGLRRISCACVHGLFADGVDHVLREAGLEQLVSTNTIPHATNQLDVSSLLVVPIQELLAR
jgi:ribose-phosphate pyrophosphokinase